MSTKTVMGIDLGTQGIKVIIYGPASKTVIANTYATYPLSSGPNGSREQNSDDWLEALYKCLSTISADIKATVKAISVSGQQHGFVALSADGDVLAPVKLWCDTSTEAECDAIMDQVGGHYACLTDVGNSIAVGYTASKILWLKNNHPNAYNQMTSVLLPHDYLNYHMTGSLVMEYGDASGTGLLSIKDKSWHQPLLDAIDADRDWSTSLPKLINADDVAGSITADFAEKSGLPTGTIVASGGGDNMMAAIGTGNVTPGRLTASLGTSGTLFGYSDTPIIDFDGDLAAFCSSTGGWLPLLCTMNCTVATEQIRHLIDVDVIDIDAVAGAVPAGCDGALTLPYYNGERTPNLPNGKAVIFGLDTTNCTKGHLLRSAMEAGIFGLRTGIEAFSRCGMTFDEVVLTGGGSNSGIWRQITADILGLTVNVVSHEENAAFGASLQALWCLHRSEGDEISIKDLVDSHLAFVPEKSCSPNPENEKIYNGVYKQYQNLVRTLTPIFKDK